MGVNLADTQEGSVCGTEYEKWCEVSHPLCEFYRSTCTDPVPEIFPKYIEPLYFSNISEDLGTESQVTEGCPAIVKNPELDNVMINYQACTLNNLDAVQKLIPVSGYMPKIHTNGRDYLITWYDNNLYVDRTFAFYAKRISYCGTKSDQIPIEIKAPFIENGYQNYSIASDGKDYMITMLAKSDNLYKVVIYIVTEEGNVIFKDKGKALDYAGGMIYNPKISFSNGYYYIVGPRRINVYEGLGAWKVDTSGNIIDSKFIYLPPVGEYIYLIDLAYDGSYFTIFWENKLYDRNNTIYAIQFDENLDPRQVSPVSIISFQEWSIASRAIYHNGNYLISYQHQMNGVPNAFIEVDSDSLSVICRSKEINGNIKIQAPPDMISLGNGAIIYYSKEASIYARNIMDNCSMSEEVEMIKIGGWNFNVLNGIAYNGNKLITVWANFNTYSDPTYDQYPLVYAGVIGDDLKLLYKLLISENNYFQKNADITYGEQGYLVVFQDYRDSISSIYGGKINSKRELISDISLIRKSVFPVVLPAVAYNGTKYALISYDFTYSETERLWANFIEDGVISDDILITEEGVIFWKSHKIAAFPEGFAIVYSKANGDDIEVVARILYNNGVLSNEINLSDNAAIQAQADVIYNSVRDEFFAVWADGRNGDSDLYGARFTTNGDVIRFPIREFTSEIETYPSLAISPNGYLLVWTNYLYNSNQEVLIDYNGNILTEAKVMCEHYSGFTDTAFDGENYFAVFKYLTDIRGVIIDAITGEVDTLCGISLASEEHHSSHVSMVATDGLSFVNSMTTLLGYPYNAWRASVNSYEKLIVEAVEPKAGCSSVGSSVLIKGRGFKEGAIAYFNGTLISTNYINCHAIEAIVPPMPAAIYNIKVINPDGEEFELANAYLSVSNAYITSIDRSHGCQTGGSWIIVSGGNFIEGVTKAYINNISVDAEYIDTAHIRFRTPEYEAGIVNVSVANANCSPAPSTISFKYVPMPNVLATNPYSGSSSGGTTVEILGEQFDETTRVFFKAEVEGEIIESDAASFSLIDSYRISAITGQFGKPDSAVATVCVQDSDCTPACLPEAFGFYKSNEYVITPKVGTASGGTKVKIFGPYLNKVMMVMFGGVRAAIEYYANDMIIARTNPRTEGIVDVLLRMKPPYPNVVLPSAYEYATLAYVMGDLPYVEVLDTTITGLLDMNPYEPGLQSKLFLPSAVRNASFSIFVPKISPDIDGRYVYFVDSERVIKVDTGTNQIVAEGPEIFPPHLPSAIWRDVGTGIMMLADKKANVLVVAANNLLGGQCGDVGGIVTLNSSSLEIIDSIQIPELADASMIDLHMLDNRAFITALQGSDGLPYYQVVVEAQISTENGHIESYTIHNTPYMITSFDGLYNIGIDILDEPCYLEQRYQCVYYPLPEANDINVFNANPECVCQKPNITEYAAYPQDVSLGYILDVGKNEYDWKAFVINAANNRVLKINDLLTTPKLDWHTLDIQGNTPVDSEFRLPDHDILFIVNTNSTGIEHDVSFIPDLPNWPDSHERGITEISDDFHPKAIAIQLVLQSSSFIELARSDLESMIDEDFTAPSKRQVLINKLDVIENLIKNKANVQAILANIEVFQNNTEKFVVNEQRKEELLAYSEAIAQSIIK